MLFIATIIGSIKYNKYHVIIMSKALILKFETQYTGETRFNR